MRRRNFLKFAGGAGALLAAPSLRAQPAPSVADFYRGRIVKIIVGATPGGGYDMVARIIARSLGRHIPGNPSFVVENLPAASGLVMANHLYNQAARDGSTLGLPTNVTALEPRLKVLTRAGGNAAFDITKFHWLGTAARQPQVLVVWHKTGVERAEQLKTRKTIIAAISVGSDSFVLPVVMNNVLDGKMQIVPGYEGLHDSLIALERGESEGANASFAGLLANKPDWIRQKLLNILIQFGRERLSQLPDVPTAMELATDERDRKALEFYSYKYDMAYAMITPPDVPADRVAALTAAFEATMSDPEYVEAAKKIELPLNSLNGAEVTKIIDAIQSTPQDIVDRMRGLMVPKT